MIGARIESDNEQLKNGHGYDHNWVLSREGDGVELVASLYEPTTGRVMEVLTDQPGLRFYSGNFFNGLRASASTDVRSPPGVSSARNAALPDSPNQRTFPTTRLNPGETYAHRAFSPRRVDWLPGFGESCRVCSPFLYVVFRRFWCDPLPGMLRRFG